MSDARLCVQMGAWLAAIIAAMLTTAALVPTWWSGPAAGLLVSAACAAWIAWKIRSEQ
jgi:hypothetical protein